MRRKYVQRNNVLTSSEHYATILKTYNKLFDEHQAKGTFLNDGKFWEEHIKPFLPEYSKQSWYYFIRKFKTQAGIAAVCDSEGREVLKYEGSPENPDDNDPGMLEEIALGDKLLTNEVATNDGIRKALNIGKGAFDKLMNHPEQLSIKERANIFFLAMKAQDSRIHALGKVKEDAREDMKMERAFENSLYEDDDDE